ncbi:hypothetical protein BASA83_011064 [Batrachochytrium salamandrivorans]|nr:hypothetical protein BASA81_010097 [Batrachochytrium salamandrivorans]KAH9265662.1 hypothetical protein BASA83_011064 [Batrachochytrium salamandrivorans]
MASLYRSVVLLLSIATIQVQATEWDVEGIKGGYQQQQPELQQTTLQADSPYVGPRLRSSPRLTRPICLARGKSERYLKKEKMEENYPQFIDCENKYLKSEYNYVKKPSTGKHSSHLQVGSKKSDGSKVLLKTIERDYIMSHTLESTPPPKSHSIEVSALYGKHAGARCTSPRPQSLLLPLEIETQKYLSQPGYENPHVLEVIDYIVTEDAYILVMEYPGEDWVVLDEYLKKYDKLFVNEVRPLIKKVIKVSLSLKKFGIAHGCVTESNVLYNKDTGGVKLMNFELSRPLKGWNQGSSASRSSEDEPPFWGTEKDSMMDIGRLMYRLLTSEPPSQSSSTRGEFAKKLGDNLNDPRSQRSINLVDLVFVLLGQGSYEMTLGDTLDHPFFTSQ